MKSILAFVLSVFFISVSVTNAQESNVKLGIHAWHIDISSDGSDGDATFWGPLLTFDISDNYWFKGSLLIGEEDYPRSTTDVTTFDLIIGRAVNIIDLGIGYRYWNNDFRSGGSSDENGPIVSAGIAHTFEPSLLKFYGDLTWNFVDFGDTEEQEHYTLEGGVSYNINKFDLSIGYRFKHYYDYHDYKYKGITGSAVYHF